MKEFLFTWIVIVGDVAIYYAALALALILRQPTHFSAANFLRHAVVFTSTLPSWFVVNYVLGLYNFRQIRELPNLIADSVLAFFYNVVLFVVIFYVFSAHMMTPRAVLVLALGLSYLGGFSWRRLSLNAVSWGFLARRVAFLGNNELMQEMEADLKTRRYGQFRLLPRRKLLSWYARQSRGSTASLRRQVDLVVVAADQIESNKDFANAVIGMAIAEDVPLFIHLDFYEALYKKIYPAHAARPTWLFNNVLNKKNEVYFFFKRAADVALSALALIVLAPFAALLALVIWAVDGRPVFYAQKRLGFLNREFLFWKFRTMLPDVDKKGYLWNVSSHDPRVTPLGRLLRRYRLDEIPQLWNILRGDMSFVGPRPTWIGERQALELANYHLRHLVKPGLTGWAQINSRATDSLEDTLNKLAYDLYYVKHVSFSEDLAIMLRTAKRVLQPEKHFAPSSSDARVPSVDAKRNAAAA